MHAGAERGFSHRAGRFVFFSRRSIPGFLNFSRFGKSFFLPFCCI
jgi:hypothetical protein